MIRTHSGIAVPGDQLYATTKCSSLDMTDPMTDVVENQDLFNLFFSFQDRVNFFFV